MNDPRGEVKFEFVKYTRGIGLDLGVGPVKAFPQFIGVRERKDEVFLSGERRFVEVASFAQLEDFEDAACDFILAAGVTGIYAAGGGMDGVDRLHEWLRCIKVDGYLCVYEPALPDTRMLEHCAELLSDHIRIVQLGMYPAGGAYLVLQKLGSVVSDLPLRTEWAVEQASRPQKTACVVRHGGIGDQIQAAFLLPELKRQGYHVTVLTTEKGKTVLAHDPHIDEFYLVDHNHVPNGELHRFWRSLKRHYTKLVNLNESVEGTFLPPPGRPNHAWPLSLRQKMLNVNYAEFAADLAEIPFRPEGRFYPTADEERWAREFIADLPGQQATDFVRGMVAEPVYVILWVLSGSSRHKFSPHQDTIIKLILERLNRAVIVMVGDEVCKILQVGWDDQPRVVQKSGELELRQSLTLAREVDLVIGPETGLLNSVAYHNVRKILLLSHSSHENLSKHWQNTEAIPGVAACYPCHQLHPTGEFCPQDDKTGAALCQQGVSPARIYAAIDADYVGWVRAKLLRAA